MIVRTAPRALGGAIAPLAILNAFMLAAAALGRQATDHSALLSPDRMLILLTALILLESGLLFGVHMAARALGIGGRAAYAGLGAAAAALAYALSMLTGLWPAVVIPGAVIFGALLPTAFGALAGFLYQRGAGPDFDSVVQVRRTYPGASAKAVAEAPKTFDGPVQVRTSFAGFAIASGMPALLVIIAVFALGGSNLLGFGGFGYPPPAASTVLTGLAFFLQTFLILAMVTAIPSLVLIAIAHATLRGMRQTSAGAYATAGAVIAIVLPILLTMGRGVLIAVPCAVAGAIVMAIYRAIAGIEPLSLPETVIVHDRATMVGADDPARHTHRVVMS